MTPEDITLWYFGIIILVIILNIAAYFFLYQSIISTYKETTSSIIAEYDKVVSLYLQVYLQYLKLMQAYLNASIANGILPASLPAPPSLNLPQLPLSITISPPTQVSPPVTSWPPLPPVTTTTTTST